MLTSPLTNFEINGYDQDQDEPKFNGVYSRNNVPIKICNKSWWV